MEQNNITICGQDLAYENKCCCGCQDEDKEKENIFDNIEIDATVDNTTGEPSVTVVPDEENNKYTFVFTGLKGETGDPGDDADPLLFDDLTEEQKAELKGEQGPRGPQGNTGEKGDTGAKGPKGDDGIDGKPGTYPNITAHADIGNTVGNPSVRVTVDGEDPQNPVFNFYFDGIKGPAGANGTNGTNGKDGKDGIDGKDGEDGKVGIDAKAEDIEAAVTSEIERQLDEWDDELQVAGWLKYAINGHENDKESFAQLIAGARDAYAGVNALVRKENGQYTATSTLLSLIRDAQTGTTTSESGVISQSTIEEAVLDMFATNNANGNTATARIFAIANASGSTLKLDADHINLDASDINAITKNSALETGSLKIKAGDWSGNSKEISLSGDSNGKLTISAKHIELDDNSDAGWLYVNKEHIYLGDEFTSNIVIGDPNAVDCDVIINNALTLQEQIPNPDQSDPNSTPTITKTVSITAS